MSAKIRALVRGDNADLMVSVAALYDLGTNILDATYGKGSFWSKLPDIHPAMVLANDLDPRCTAETMFDFRQFPERWGNMWSTVVFDPPYVAMGGRKTSTVHEMTDAYGMLNTPATPGALWTELIQPGMRECYRCVKPGGLLLVKCMDYISSGRLQLPWFTVLYEAHELGATVEDYFILDTNPGPQPSVNLDGTPRRQVHAQHSGISFLTVLRKPGKAAS